MSATSKSDSLASLEEALRKLGRDIPHSLRELLLNARSLSGKPTDAPDKDLRSWIYKSMYSFLVYENGVGDGDSLIYPPEIVATIRKLYPGDIKDYPPQSRKRRNFYEVELEELVILYEEADMREGFRRAFASLPPLEKQEDSTDKPGPSKKKKE